jgi:hypothetical protein
MREMKIVERIQGFFRSFYADRQFKLIGDHSMVDLLKSKSIFRNGLSADRKNPSIHFC